MLPIDTNNTALKQVFEISERSGQMEINAIIEERRRINQMGESIEKANMENKIGFLLSQNENLRNQHEHDKQYLAKSLIVSLSYRELMYKYGIALGKI